MELTARNVHYTYDADTSVLDSVSVTVRDGQIVYLLGRNGSGKTTLMTCLSGVFRPTQGQVELDGVDIQRYKAGTRARLVGLIPQVHVPAFAYSVREMVLMGRAPHLSLFGSPGKDDYAIADGALDSIGMADYSDRPYTALSGGERQLVMIARGLTQQCRILLMDEPDAHLDLNNQHRVMQIVTDLAHREKLSFVVSSHVPNNALLYADRVLLLKKGRMLALGTVEETLTEALLSEAYSMDTEVIYRSENGSRIPHAILPRRLK